MRVHKLLIVSSDDGICSQLLSIDWRELDITHVERCVNFQEAIHIGPNYRPDIVVTGLHLNGGMGHDLIEKYQAMDIKSSFIIMSIYDNYHYVRQSMLLGAKDYVIKSKALDKKEFKGVVARVIEENLKNTVVNVLDDNILKAHQDCDQLTGRSIKKYSDITIRVLEILKKEYNKNISIKSISDKILMNSKYIGKQFINDTGLCFTDYRFAFRMHLAEQLIVQTNYKIQEIANQVGYAYPNHFFKDFKIYFGISPNEVRREGRISKYVN